MAQIDRITLDPAIRGGKPCIRGQRVTVATVLGLLAAGDWRSTSTGSRNHGLGSIK